MGKYVFKFDTVVEYNEEKSNLIRPHLAYCVDTEDVKCAKFINNNNIPFIDLDLPSGRLWATTNLGGNVTTDEGNLYAWGETTTKGTYSEATYRWTSINDTEYEKYNSSDDLITLDAADDVATVINGGSWHIPSVADFKELLSNTTRTMSDTSWTFTSKINGVQLVLPRRLDLWVNKVCTGSSAKMAFLFTYDMNEYGELQYVDVTSIYRWRSACVRPVL